MDKFWERAEISVGFNASYITLIPKNPNPVGLNEFRPISLIGVYYKINAKVLSERLKKIMGKLIGEIQTAFVKRKVHS